MARNTETREIGGFTYQTTQLGATQGRKVGTRLIRLIGKAVESKEPIGSILSALTDEDLTFLCDTFGAITTVTGGIYADRAPFVKDVFEEQFAGHLGFMCKWLAFCLEVNFSNFLSELGLDAILSRAKMEEKASSFLKAATGLSGA